MLTSLWLSLPPSFLEQAAGRLPSRRMNTVFQNCDTGNGDTMKNRGGAVGCTTSLPSVMPLGRGKRR